MWVLCGRPQPVYVKMRARYESADGSIAELGAVIPALNRGGAGPAHRRLALPDGHIPHRNLVLITTAAGHLSPDTVIVGALWGGAPDKSRAFHRAASRALRCRAARGAGVGPGVPVDETGLLARALDHCPEVDRVGAVHPVLLDPDEARATAARPASGGRWRSSTAGCAAPARRLPFGVDASAGWAATRTAGPTRLPAVAVNNATAAPPWPGSGCTPPDGRLGPGRGADPVGAGRRAGGGGGRRARGDDRRPRAPGRVGGVVGADPADVGAGAGPHRRRPARGPPPGRGRRCRVPAHDRVDGTVEGWNTAPTAPPYDAALRTFTAPLVDVPALARALTADVLVSDCEGGECALLRGRPACVRMVVVEWHPHLVGSGRGGGQNDGVGREGLGRVDGAVRQLDGGFTGMEVWTRSVQGRGIRCSASHVLGGLPDGHPAAPARAQLRGAGGADGGVVGPWGWCSTTHLSRSNVAGRGGGHRRLNRSFFTVRVEPVGGNPDRCLTTMLLEVMMLPVSVHPRVWVSESGNMACGVAV